MVERRHEAPARASLVLLALILVAAVANLNLTVANVALPTIGKHFDSSQTTLVAQRSPRRRAATGSGAADRAGHGLRRIRWQS